METLEGRPQHVPPLDTDFARPADVAALAADRFSLAELVEAIDAKPESIRNVVYRDKLSLISIPPGASGRVGRQFHILDIYAIALHVALKGATKIPVEKLVSELSHVIFGDPMSPAEMRDRRASVVEDRVRAKKRGKLPKHDKFLFELHEGRRAELSENIFAAAPLWWHRSDTQHFVFFVKRTGEIFVALVDRNANGGLIDPRPLQAMGVVSFLNVTKSLADLDIKLAEIVKNRGEDREA